MSTSRLQEVLICFGKQKQADIATANTGVQMWQLRKLNAALANPKLNTESDAEDDETVLAERLHALGYI